jgi:large subunit ribosomal protein L22
LSKQNKVVENNIEVIAKGRFIWGSPFKIRRVAKLIRGKNILEAKAILKALPHKSSRVLGKLLMSAIANAKNNNKLDEGSLYVKRVLVDEGPRHKRYQPRARGRMYQIVKKTSQLLVGLGTVEGDK